MSIAVCDLRTVGVGEALEVRSVHADSFRVSCHSSVVKQPLQGFTSVEQWEALTAALALVAFLLSSHRSRAPSGSRFRSWALTHPGRTNTKGRWGAPERPGFWLKGQSGETTRKGRKTHVMVVGAKSKLV